MDRKTIEARLEYYDSQVEAAERALEYRREQRFICLRQLGELAIQEMIEDGKL